MLTDPARAFLDMTRLGFFSYRVETAGWSRPGPVWFEWAADAARVFSSATAPKVDAYTLTPSHISSSPTRSASPTWV